MKQLREFFSRLFNYSDWPPRWHCGNWSQFHGWLYIISDLLIWGAYFTLPIIILKYISRKSGPKFIKLYFLFAAFILACGATHFLDAVAFWFPVYRLNALVRLVTAIVSWLTVYYIIRHLPVAFSLRSQRVLEKEIEQRKQIEIELRESEEKLKTIYKNAPDAVVVISSAGNIIIWNPAAEKMFGWKESEAMGKVLNELVVPEKFREGYIKEMKNFLKTGQSQVLKQPTLQTVICKDNSYKKVEFNVSPVKVKEDFLFIGFVRDVTEKKKAEEALMESEERYRLLTTEVQDYAIIMLSPEGNISSWNEGAQRITGYTEGEIIGKHLSTFFTKEDLENKLPWEELGITSRVGRYQNEGKRVKKDGSLFWANIVLTALKREGKIIGYSKITRDISAQKKWEEEIKLLNNSLELRVLQRTEELEQSEKKYRKLFENSPMPMWVIDLPSLKFLDVNEAAIIHYGYTREEFLSMSAEDIRPDDEKQRFREFNLSNTKGISKTGIWKHVKKDGAVIDVDVNSHTINFGGGTARLVLSIDITDRRKAEERLDFALEAGEIGIWELDLVNDTSIRSLRHDQIFGHKEILAEWGFETFMSHIHPEDVAWVKESFKEAFKTKTSVIETRIIWPDKSLHWVLIKGEIMLDNKNQPLKMLGTIIDISKLKAAEAAIRELNNELEQRVEIRTRELYAANKELESFSYSVSHDLRAPLRAINGYSQILQQDYTVVLNAEGNKLLTRIMVNVKKMSGLIDDLLEFSRMGKKALNKTSIDMNKIIKNVVQELSHSDKYYHDIIVGNLGMAIADEVFIQLVFQNLLLNATKYSSKKEDPVVEVGVTETEKGTAYFVKDNGAGFDMAYADKLFGVFQRLHTQEEFEGTGVGLAIVQKIILKHGGQVWAESVVNEGLLFILHFNNLKLLKWIVAKAEKHTL